MAEIDDTLIPNVLGISGNVNSINGGSTGTATVTAVLKGGLIFTQVALNNFKTGGANQSLALPIPYNHGASITTGDIPGFKFQSGGVDVTCVVTTALAVAGGTTSSSVNLNGHSMIESRDPSGAMDTIIFASGNSSGHYGYLTMIGT